MSGVSTAHARVAAYGRHRPGSEEERQAWADLLYQRALRNARRTAALCPRVLTVEQLTELSDIMLRRVFELTDDEDERDPWRFL